MSSNVSTLLSLIIVSAFFIMGGDMVCLSSAYSSLDNVSNTISYCIAKDRKTDSVYLKTLENKYNVKFLNISSNNPSYGDVVDFTIYRNYHPLVLSSKDIRLAVKRTTVIGYYG